MADPNLAAARLRIGGLVFLLCGAALVWIGVHLFTGILGWRLPLDGAGLSVLWLMVSGAVTIAMGAEMLIHQWRPRGTLRLLILLLTIFVVTGVVVALAEGGRLPRFYR
jgi:uncharacterized membrane protein